MTHTGIAQRLIAKHGIATAYGLCRSRVVVALSRKRDIALYGWFRVAEIIKRIGNARGWIDA